MLKLLHRMQHWSCSKYSGYKVLVLAGSERFTVSCQPKTGHRETSPCLLVAKDSLSLDSPSQKRDTEKRPRVSCPCLLPAKNGTPRNVPLSRLTRKRDTEKRPLVSIINNEEIALWKETNY